MLEFNGDLSVEDGSGLPNKLLGDLHYNKDVSHLFLYILPRMMSLKVQELNRERP